MNPRSFSTLSFDCYGTLIDWETGILQALGPMLRRYRITQVDQDLLETFARFEAEVEGEAYRSYREVLREVVIRIGRTLNFTPSIEEEIAFSDSVKSWPPFADSTEALRALQTKYNLIILSNVDDDLFQHSAELMGIRFDTVFTAQQIGSYKPSEQNFHYLIEHAGVPKEQILHVAQSLFHDIEPAKRLGISTVWVNRREGKEGSGATLPGAATPDFVVPDLKTLVEML